MVRGCNAVSFQFRGVKCCAGGGQGHGRAGCVSGDTVGSSLKKVCVLTWRSFIVMVHTLHTVHTMVYSKGCDQLMDFLLSLW